MNILPSPALLVYFKEYEDVHRTKGNKVCHYVGLPTVMFSLLGLLSYVALWAPGGEAIGVDAATAAANALFRLDLGFIVFVLGSLFAIKTDFKLSIPFILMSYLMYLTSRQVPLAILGAIQAIGWFFQLYGHYKYEKKSPAFFKSLEHLFVGPMWLFARMIGYY